MSEPRGPLGARAAAIARAAGREILEVYAQEGSAPTLKADASPLTAADLRSHRLIVSALAALTPGVPVLSEEAARPPYAERARWARHWLVDPLDGTREFLSRNGEFTVNIALVEAHAPVLGVVHVPVSDTTYRGIPGEGAWRQVGDAPARPVRVAARAADPVRVVGSRSHRGDSLEGFLARLGAHALREVGSSLKLCMIAEGAADVYPRLGPTSEWDTAAAHAVLVAAGGTVVQLDGEPLRYNTRDSLLNPFFVAYGDPGRDWLGLLRT
ncbi:MAG TPA: 3'(2'),5'-bisphosphate nucleotidase CysQ [Steroidobacteraceae bacterium]|nr:3'(2'),5'-bisphosphate nucleotidase CysQ [Steroidobacteraceae bacterium]